jgi:hypothetical protein
MMLIKVDGVTTQISEARIECLGHIFRTPQWRRRELGRNNDVFSLCKLTQPPL